MRIDIEPLSEYLKWRSYIFTCSYETAWNNYIDESLKVYTFDEVYDYIQSKRKR